jgi:hypothetical protein
MIENISCNINELFSRDGLVWNLHIFSPKAVQSEDVQIMELNLIGRGRNMKRLVSVLFCLMLVIGLAVGVQASPLPPTAAVTLGNGSPLNITMQFDQPTNSWLGTFNFMQGTLSATGFVTMSDPSITYGITAMNFGSTPAAFAFSFLLPMDAATHVVAQASLSYSLTDSTMNGISLAPNTAVQTAALLPGAVGFSLLDNTGFTAAGGFPNSYVVGPFDTAPTLEAGGPYTSLGVDTAFTLSGNFDVVTLNGFAEVTPLPLPGAVWLLGSGLVGLIGLKRRRC